MSWFILFCAGLCEISWAVGLKYSDGLKKPLPTLMTVLALALSIVLLAWSIRSLPIGTAYAVWTGIGAVGVVIAGVFLFGEPLNLMRLLFLSLILIGILGLKWSSAQSGI